MPSLKLYLLGPPKLELDERPIKVTRRKALALLSYLASEGGGYTRDELATLFWPEYEPAQSYAYLRRALWELNDVLGKGWLDAGRERVDLAANDAFWLDTAVFERELSSGDRDSVPTGSLEATAAAVALYRGDFMAGFTLRDAPEFDMWQRFKSERLIYLLARALERLVLEYEAQAETEQALKYARRWLSLDPMHEPAHRAMMRLYATSGQRAAAARQYDACAAILEEELGLPPQAETTALQQQIAQGDWPPGDESPDSNSVATPAGRRSPRRTVRLPVQPTPFVGRRDETKAILNLLTEPSCRLLSLTGPGGSGKSRLAIHAADQLAKQAHPAVADGAYFVALAPLASADAIGPAIGKSLGGDFYQEGEEPRRQLINYLRTKRIVLVLDNFEHLLDEEAVALLADLLAELVDLKLLVTSRSRLNVRGEHLFPVAGLKAPSKSTVDGLPAGHKQIEVTEAQSYSALRLFLQSAQMAKPDFELVPENLAAVVSICQGVQGMPLAIELAAGWIDVLPPAEIAAEIERSLDFLATELQDVPERQRSIRAVFESSWKLLDDRERQIMARLSVFRGGFERRAAEQVSRATLRDLLSLSSKSWLQREAAGRFQIHELLRQYAGEKLAAEPAEWEHANDQHAAFFADLLTSAGGEMSGPDQVAAIRQVAAEFDNIGVAWRWHVEKERFALLIHKMLPPLFRFSATRSTGEELLSLVRLASEALRPDHDAPPVDEWSAILLVYEIRARFLVSYWDSYQELILRARSYVQDEGLEHYSDWLLLLAEAFAWQVDRNEGARWLARLADKARTASDVWGEAYADLCLADIVSVDGQYVLALSAAKNAQQIFHQLGDSDMEAFTLRRMGSTLWKTGDYDQAETVLLAGRDLFRATDNPLGEAEIVQELHEMNLMAGRFGRAFAYFAERREIAWALDQRQMVHESLHWESMQTARFGDLKRARELRYEALELARALGDPLRVAWSVWEMGELLRLDGDLSGAHRWYDDALNHFKDIEFVLGIGFYNRGLGDIALMEGHSSDARDRFEIYLNLAQADGHIWSIAYALSGLGRAEVALGELDLAEQHFREAFRQAYFISRDLCMAPLYGLALWLAANKKPVQAIELAAFVANYHLSWRETRGLATALIAASSDQLSADKLEAAAERGRCQDLDSVIVEYALEAKEAADG